MPAEPCYGCMSSGKECLCGDERWPHGGLKREYHESGYSKPRSKEEEELFDFIY